MLKIGNIFNHKNEGMRDAVAKREDAVKQEQSQDFRYDCENFAGIVKISQSLRKFRNPSEIENFR